MSVKPLLMPWAFATASRVALALVFALPTDAWGDEPVFAPHPAAGALDRVFRAASERTDFKPTGIARRDYLTLVGGGVDFFKQHQNGGGAIIDPYAKREIQYATPAFALAAAALVAHANRDDLLEPAVRALTCAVKALAEKRAADKHPDFYIPFIMHARRLLADRVPAETRADWDRRLRSIEPEKIYRMDLKGMNWNIVSTVGEFLRRKDGLVDPARSDAQLKYLEQALAGHRDEFTAAGMYFEGGSPLAYDAFSRMWLEDLIADGAYTGPAAAEWAQTLRLGALSGLLLLSPSGEWASGGRSGLHNWTEAENAVICEIEANRWKAAGRDDVAGAFKRAAHLAFQSMQRWQRPTGELWIVKNRAEPDARHGLEHYSHHSQYNLQAVAMLAMAYNRADDAIVERPTPSEMGGYVFDVRDTFNKVAAAAGGYYVLVDTAGDPHYTATGLQRVHRAGVAFPPLSDSTAAERAYSPKDAPKLAMTPGIQWTMSNSAEAPWRSLADFVQENPKSKGEPVRKVSVSVGRASPDAVEFTIEYTLDGSEQGGGGRPLVETYALSSAGVECAQQLHGGGAPAGLRVRLPVLVSNGAQPTDMSIGGTRATIAQRGSVMTIDVIEPKAGIDLKLDGPETVSHNGLVRAAISKLPPDEPAPTGARWRIRLEQRFPDESTPTTR